MPIIDDIRFPPVTSGDIPAIVYPFAVLGGAAILSADLTGTQGLRATLPGSATLSATLSGTIEGAATLAGFATLFARGRLNGEPNEFGSATLAGIATLFAGATYSAAGKAIINGTSSIVARGHRIQADRTILNVVLNVLPADNAAFGDTISARLTANDVAYPIRAATYSEPASAAGVSLQVTLQKPGDREAILSADSFKFEIYTGGEWNLIFETGRRSAGGFSLAWIDGRPDDSLQISTIGPVSDRINKSPTDDLTVYDSVRETIAAEDFKTIYDTDGNAYVRTLYAIPDMQLSDLLEYIFVTRCGFSGVETDLPDFPIRRADFEKTGTFLSGIAAHIGAFDPLIFVKDDVVWILDSTQTVPAGFASPIELEADKYKSANLSETVLNADGFLCTYAAGDEYDYYSDRLVVDAPETTGTSGASDYTRTIRQRIFRDFYKESDPLVPVRTEKIREIETIQSKVDGVLTETHESQEYITLDDRGRVSRIQKTVTGLVPDLATPSFPFITRTVRTELTNFNYTPQLNVNGRVILSKTVKQVRGLVTIDNDNEHLDRPFKQSFVDGFRAGNLSDALDLEFGPISTTIETIGQNERGQYEMRTRTVDFMTTPPSVTNQTTDARAGDISSNALGGTPETVIILRPGATRTDAKLIPINVGELPLKFAIPLCRRRLASPTKRTGPVALKGLQLAFGRGLTFTLMDRDGEDAGKYIVEGRTIALNNLGTREQNSIQTLDIVQIK